MSNVQSIIENILEHQSAVELPVGQLELRTNRIDSRFVDRGVTLKRTDKIWDKVNKVMVDTQLPFINAKPEYKKAYAEGTINSVDSIVAKKYYKEVSDRYFDEYKKLLDNPVSKQYVMILDDMSYLGFMIKTVTVVPTNDDFVRITLVRDSKGWITGFEIVDPTVMLQSSMFIDDILEHHGVKGMKWGIHRRITTSSGFKGLSKLTQKNVQAHNRRVSARNQKEKNKKLAKADKQFEKSINLDTWIKIHNAAANATNEKHIDRINNKPEYKAAAKRGDFHDDNKPITQKYFREHQQAFLGEVRKAADDLGTNASGTRKYQISTDANGNWAVSTTEVKHEDSIITVKVNRNALGEITNLEILKDMAQSSIFVEDFLEHHGIKGMKWGHRKAVHPDIMSVPKKTRKEASKDAEEFTRAKLFFGQGAGTRRKLIKAKVESKRAKDPHYAKAFDHFVKQTDLGERAHQARKERKRTDKKNYAKKTARGVGHVVRGNNQYANTAAILGVGAGSIVLNKYLKQDDIEDESVLETMGVGEEFLEHHGVKGMKWGVRKAASSRVQRVKKARARATSSRVTVTDKKKKIKTSGGKGRPAHADAVNARTTGQIAKKSGHKALSNAELEAYNKRLNLEQNFNRLSFQDKSRGAKFVSTLLGKNAGKGVEQGTKAALGSVAVRKKAAAGAAALAIAL